MNRPKWLETYIQSKPGVKDQITVLGNRGMPGVMNTGMRNMGGGTTYMGAGPDNRVQPQKPVMMDMLALHEGETVVPASEVAAAGGPMVVKSAVDQQIMERQQKMPGVMRADTGLNYGAEQFFTPEQMAAQTKRVPVQMPAETFFTPQQMAAQTKQPALAPTFDFTTREASQDAMSTGGFVQGDAATLAAQKAAKAAPVQMGAETFFTPQQMAAQTKTPAPVAKANAGMLPGETAAQYSLRLRNAEASNYSPTDMAQQNVISNQIAIREGNKTSGTTSGSNGFIDRTLRGTLQRANDLASGKSAMYNRLSNNAFNQLDPRLAAQDTALRMQIANNPNMTAGGANTALAAGARDAGSQQSQLAGDLAKNAVNMAVDANQQANNMATSQQAFNRGVTESDRAFNWDRDNTAMTAALTAGDIDTYATLAEKTLGITVNRDALKDSQNVTNLTDGLGLLGKLLISNPTPKLTDAGVRSALELIWKGNGNTTPMDEAWATSELSAQAERATPWYQALNYMPESQARATLGDKYINEFVDSVTKKTGYQGFQLALARELQNGGMKRDPSTGAISWNGDVGSIINNLMGGTTNTSTTSTTTTLPGGKTVANLGAEAQSGNTATPTTEWTVGKPVTLANGSQFIVGGVDDGTGEKFLVDAKGALYDASGVALSADAVAGIGVYTGIGGKAYYDGKPVAIMGGTGAVTLNAKDPTKGTDAQGKAVVVGEDGTAYYPGFAVGGDNNVYRDGELVEGYAPATYQMSTREPAITIKSSIGPVFDNNGVLKIYDLSTKSMRDYSIKDYQQDIKTGTIGGDGSLKVLEKLLDGDHAVFSAIKISDDKQLISDAIGIGARLGIQAAIDEGVRLALAGESKYLLIPEVSAAMPKPAPPAISGPLGRLS